MRLVAIEVGVEVFVAQARVRVPAVRIMVDDVLGHFLESVQHLPQARELHTASHALVHEVNQPVAIRQLALEVCGAYALVVLYHALGLGKERI